MELDLVGVHEITEMLGVSRQRVNEIAQTHDDFPDPVAVLAAGRIWLRADVVTWASEWDRRAGRRYPTERDGDS